VNRFITESVGLLRRLVGSRIVLQLQLAPDAGQVLADPSQLQQVLMNLIANARDAMQFGGRLTINTSMTEVAASGTDTMEIPPGHYVALQVADTGHGMDEATQARIFEPLFTTKDIEKGSGLGLATVQSIVKKLGGSIRVESSPGNGARFWIYLPSVDQQQTVEVQGSTPIA
jgi:signal transduction histidine kinase